MPNQTLVDRLATLPHQPGVYRMLDEAGGLLYVGKARDLKKRVHQYFQKNITDPKTLALLSHIHTVEVIVTTTETEALLLENKLIKQHKPKYNILLRDDKTYPYLYIHTTHNFPSLMIHRSKFLPSIGHVFGPYPNTGAVHHTLNLLQKCFKLRNCQDATFSSRSRPCLQYQMKRCTAPCTGYISQEQYAQSVKHAIDFLKGKSTSIITQLTLDMETAVTQLAFEEAARIRDQIQQLRIIQQSHAMKDWLALAGEETPPEPTAPVPSIESKYERQFRLLTQALKSPHPLHSVVCFDVSHTRGQATYASCVVFNEQGPDRAAYRHFSIKDVTPGDDYGALRQAIARYYHALLASDTALPDVLLIDGGKGQVNAAHSILATLPLNSIRLLGITKGFHRQARFDRIFDASSHAFLELAPHDEALHLLQQLRDEAHRFVLSIHRKKRAKLQLESTLTQLKGIGPKRRKALLQHFGGFQSLVKATYQELCQVPGISPTLADRLLNHFEQFKK